MNKEQFIIDTCVGRKVQILLPIYKDGAKVSNKILAAGLVERVYVVCNLDDTESIIFKLEDLDPINVNDLEVELL